MMLPVRWEAEQRFIRLQLIHTLLVYFLLSSLLSVCLCVCDGPERMQEVATVSEQEAECLYQPADAAAGLNLPLNNDSMSLQQM